MLETLRNKFMGYFAEYKACLFLKKQGLTFITNNYHCHFGEIDLIMQDRQEIVFVEVRLRSQSKYGDALDTIDSNKQKKLIKSAAYYLHKKGLTDKVDYRFDAIGYTNGRLDWIKDAFNYE